MKILLFIFLLTVTQTVWAEKLFFIVNSASSVNKLSKAQIQDMFFKNVREWSDGTPVRFFDRLDQSSERNVFVKEYLNKTSRQLDQHWIGQKLYSGDSAPTKIPSDSLVATLVARFPGGIGYVSGSFSGAPGVKIIEVGD